MFGYMGKILRVDLSKSKITEEFPDENTFKDVFGWKWTSNQISL